MNEFIYFDTFMHEALYSESGVFNTETVRSSEKGDFLTSPEVSPLSILNILPEPALDLNLSASPDVVLSLIHISEPTRPY